MAGLVEVFLKGNLAVLQICAVVVVCPKLGRELGILCSVLTDAVKFNLQGAQALVLELAVFHVSQQRWVVDVI